MSPSIQQIVDLLLSSPGQSVRAAGETMLRAVSDGRTDPAAFLSDPRTFAGSGSGVSRYLAQVIQHALEERSPTVDDVIESLYAVLDRNPPALEPRAGPGASPEKVSIPEVRVLALTPFPDDGGFEAYVTSGEWRDREIRVYAGAAAHPAAAALVPHLWTHAAVALYNLEPRPAPGEFQAGPETFFVLEPLRQVNASSLARSLHCPKPILDQARQGRGDATVHALKGTIVHNMWDRIIQGEDDLAACYDAVVAPFLVQLAALADERFDERHFYGDVLRHAAALKDFVDLNPHMREDPQVELRRYSATIGIQGRIDAVFRTARGLDIVELKTGRRLHPEDHVQLYIYRLLLSDYLRRARQRQEDPGELSARLLSSFDGTTSPLRTDADFFKVLAARNRLVALAHALAHDPPPWALPYADYDRSVCGACPRWTHERCRQSTEQFGDRPDATADAALRHFRTYSRLVQRESWKADQDLADLLDDSRTGYRVRNFRTIPDARGQGLEAGAFVFAFEENTSDLGVGDRVLIHSGMISSTLSYHGYVRAVDGRHARIAVPLHNIPADTFDGAVWTIDRFPSDLTAEASQTGLFDFLSAPSEARKRVVLGELDARDPAPGTLFPRDLRARLDPALNSSQAEAAVRAAGCDTFHLIWGPPGTGKTRLIPEIAGATAGGVLLGAFTNTALDKMLLALLAADPAARFLRIGRSESSPELAERLGPRVAECFSEDLAGRTRDARELRRKLDEIPVVAATAHRAAAHPYVRGRSFELTVVDEAGQLTEPLTLGLVMRARRFVLIGDDRQLPPVVRVKALGRSLFERLKSEVEAARPEALTLLDVQYRMHPAIMEASNRLYYQGRLSSGVTAAERAFPAGPPLAFAPVAAEAAGRSNPEEARRTAQIVRELLEHAAPEEIGVISPYRAQVVLLRRLLADTGVTVDTVERFQGGERDVVVLSFVRRQGSEFVFDDRRFNVAITRARRKLVFVAHPDLFRGTKHEWIYGLERV